MVRKWMVGVGVAALLVGFQSLAASPAKAETKLKVGTAAAPESPWGQTFKIWKKAVETKTSNAVSFDFFFNSTQGSEATMVDKMKAGQMDGVAVTSVGLAKIDKRMLIMQVPGIIRSWKTADAIRASVGTKYEKFLNEKKVTLITYGDVGYARFFSKGFQVKVPDDLKGKNPWVYADDPILKTVWAQIGGVNAFPSELMSVLPNIDNGKINCMATSTLAAEMLQWSSKYDNAIDAVNGIVVGGLIMSTDSLDKLPADAKKTVIETGLAMGTSASGLKARIRAEDDAAWARFKARSGVQIYKPTDADVAKWNVIFKASRDKLKAGTFDAALVSEIESLAAANP